MHFRRVNVTFYDTVNIVNEVVGRANPFPYMCTAKFTFVGIRNDKTQQIRC